VTETCPPKRVKPTLLSSRTLVAVSENQRQALRILKLWYKEGIFVFVLLCSRSVETSRSRIGSIRVSTPYMTYLCVTPYSRLHRY
jgi:hypothetical protein